MTAKETKYMIANDPVFALNAIVDNNPVAVSQRLNSIGISVGEDKEQIFEALEGLALSGDKQSFRYALSVPVDIVNMNDSARSAIYGESYAHSYRNGTMMTSFATVQPMQGFLLPEPTDVNELLDELENMDGPPADEPETGNGFDWGGLLGPLMDNVFGLFDQPNGPTNDQGVLDAYLRAEQARRESTRKTITWSIIGLITLVVIYLVYRAVRSQ